MVGAAVKTRGNYASVSFFPKGDKARFLHRLDHVRTPATAPTAPGHGQKPARDFDNGKLYRSTLPTCDSTGQLMARKRSLIELVEHFWKRVDTSGDCWIWTGEVNNQGYGFYCLYEGDGREKIQAHRFSALMAGMPVHTSKDVVMHRCDTPRCVRPQHLSVGTQLDNMRDARDKGRMNTTGLFAPVTHVCKHCGTGFMGTPRDRYCTQECRHLARVARNAQSKEDA